MAINLAFLPLTFLPSSSSLNKICSPNRVNRTHISNPLLHRTGAAGHKYLPIS